MGAIYLIRHARPAVEGVLLGQSDPPLNDTGREEARAALSAMKVEAVYSSPLRRARETAAFVRALSDLIVLEDLAEISLGEWDGKTWVEVERSDPELAVRKTGDWYGVTPPGGETWAAFSTRVLRAFDRVRRGSMPAAIVAHAAVNARIAASVLNVSPEWFRQGYCEVIELDV